MIKKTLTFDDFDGNSVTEDHYFNLSMNELIEMEMSEEGGMVKKLNAILESGDGALIMRTFREFIGRSYGQRDDAQPTKFVKSPRITEDFFSSLAFDALFSELMTSTTASAEFVNGLIPKDLANTTVMKTALAEARKGGPIAGRIPDPNGLDTEGVWPGLITDGKDDAIVMTAFPDEASGLKKPRDDANTLLPWAFRHPTRDEQRNMSREQMGDVYLRLNSGWMPPDSAHITG